MTLDTDSNQPKAEPYQSVLVLCQDCGHVSLQALLDNKLYVCPTCGSTMKEVKV